MSTLSLSPFDTLQFAKRLKAAGIPESQAEAEAEVLREAVDTRDRVFAVLENQVSTQKLLSEKEAQQMATKGDIADVKGEVALIRKDMQAMQNTLVIRLSAVMVALFGLAGVLQAFTGRL